MNDGAYSPPPMIDRLRGASTPRRLALVALAVFVALAGSVVIAVVFLDTTTDDLPKLALTLLVTAIASLTAGGILLWLLQGRHGRRISARLITAHVIGILVLVINVAVAAAVLFDSADDFRLLGLLLGFAVAIAAIYSAFVSGWFSSSLDQVAVASRRLAEGDLSIRLPASGEREFADLALALNTLAGRLQHARARQHALEDGHRYLISSIILELQAPLTSLQKGLDLVGRKEMDEPDALRRLANSLQRDSTQLHQILDNLETLARIESGQLIAQQEPFDTSTLVLQVCETINPHATVRSVELLPRVNFGIAPVHADRDQVQKVLVALIESAIRQEVANGSVIVEVIDLGPEVQVNVANSAAPRHSRDPHATHTIALAIGRRLVEMNGGRIWVAQPIIGGSVSSFTLPKRLSPLASER